MILRNSLIDFLISVNKNAILKPVETMLQQVHVFLSNLYIPHKHGCRRNNEKMCYTFLSYRVALTFAFLRKQLVKQLKYNSL